MKLKERRLSKNKKQDELGKEIGVDVPMLSRFENYQCLPVPKTMDKILSALDCELEDIYEPHEVYVKPRKARKCSDEADIYKITVRLPKEARREIKNALKTCGYKDVTYWIWRCYERLLKQQEIIEKAKEKGK